jgi:hypothetical protein
MESAVPDRVLQLTTRQVDCFVQRLDYDPELQLKDGRAHWFYRTNYGSDKGSADFDEPEALMQYRGPGLADRRVNARRIAYLLHYREDPGEHVHSVCGQESCVNPAHQQARIKGSFI